MIKYISGFLFCITMLVNPTFAQQQFGGIGAQLFLDTMGGHSMPQIQGLVRNSSADQYLKATDYIIKVNDVSCLDKSLQEIVGMIRGEVGTTVKITVADTKEGKRPREYDLVRGAITTSSPGAPAPPADPVATFNTNCENEVAKMKKNGNTIIKTFPSDCGNYFFNFDVDKQEYHILVWVIANKGTEAEAKAFSVSARVFDNTNEAAATTISGYVGEWGVNSSGGKLAGTATFSKPGVGVVNVLLHDDTKICRAMYVVIYRPLPASPKER